MSGRFDAVVVGAGVGGLSAAITLAEAGKRVLVLEAHDRPGGKADVTVLEGVEVDTGPSVLTLPEVFESLIASAGLDPKRELHLRRTDPSFRYLYPDGVALDIHHALPDTLLSVESALGRQAAGELEAFMGYAARIWDAAAPVFVYGPAPSLPGILARGVAALGAVSRIDPFHTMQSAIAARVRSPHLRSLLGRYATYNGSDLRRAPATLNCIAHVELALGGFGVEGGIGALVAALVRAAQALGVEFRYATPVTQLALARGRVIGVQTRDEAIAAPAVVVNADVGHLVAALLPPTLNHGLRPRGRASMSGYTALYRARRDPDRAPHSVLFPEDYAAEFSDIFDHARVPTTPSVYACAQALCHGRKVWAEHEPLFVMANAPAEPEPGDASPHRFDALRALVRERLLGAGLIAVSDRMLWERTPADLARRFPGSRGSLYGAASNSMFAAFQRPDNRVAAVPGLFLASGSAHPGGGLPLAALSGRQAALAVLERGQVAA